jgi:hypothetical protein
VASNQQQASAKRILYSPGNAVSNPRCQHHHVVECRHQASLLELCLLSTAWHCHYSRYSTRVAACVLALLTLYAGSMT